MKWTVETLNEVVDAEVEALPADMRARLAHISKLIEEMGLEQVGQPHVKHPDDRLWEMRLSGRSGISRALYVVASGRRVVIVRVFVKKTQKTPRREIELALARAKAVIRGNMVMTRISEIHKKWMKEPQYRKAYHALEDEFAIARAVIAARKRAGLTQTELARRMGTTQPAVTRMESGRVQPSLRTLQRLARATGSRLMIKFEPHRAEREVEGRATG